MPAPPSAHPPLWSPDPVRQTHTRLWAKSASVLSAGLGAGVPPPPTTREGAVRGPSAKKGQRESGGLRMPARGWARFRGPPRPRSPARDHSRPRWLDAHTPDQRTLGWWEMLAQGWRAGREHKGVRALQGAPAHAARQGSDTPLSWRQGRHVPASAPPDLAWSTLRAPWYASCDKERLGRRELGPPTQKAPPHRRGEKPTTPRTLSSRPSAR